MAKQDAHAAGDPEKELLKAEVADLKSKVAAILKGEGGIVIDPRYEEFKAWALLSSQEKTQLQADKKYGAPVGECFEVQLVETGAKHQVFPKVRLAGHSPEEAQARYQVLCGINNITHPERQKYVVTPITLAA